MRAELSSGSLVESVVTLAAAALMTVAGLAMIEDLVPTDTTANTVATRASVPGPAG